MNKQLAIPMTLPTGNMDAYVSAAFQLPMLSAEDEHDLAVRLRDHQDLEAIGASVKIAQQQAAPSAIVLNACPPPQHDRETAIVREARDALQVYGLPVAPVSIAQRAAFSHALIDGRAVTEFEDSGKAANEIRRLWQWVESRW